MQPNANGAGFSCDSPILLSTKEGYEDEIKERHKAVLEADIEFGEYPGYSLDSRLDAQFEGDLDGEQYFITGLLHSIVTSVSGTGRVPQVRQLYNFLPRSAWNWNTEKWGCRACRDSEMPGQHHPSCPVFQRSVVISVGENYEIVYRLRTLSWSREIVTRDVHHDTDIFEISEEF